MRHGRPLIKQFETETERTLRLVVDASASMDYRSDPSHLRKLDMAALIGAAAVYAFVSWRGASEPGAPSSPAVATPAVADDARSEPPKGAASTPSAVAQRTKLAP